MFAQIFILPRKANMFGQWILSQMGEGGGGGGGIRGEYFSFEVLATEREGLSHARGDFFGFWGTKTRFLVRYKV